MALADADFAWRYPAGDATVFIECDGRVCYAYVGVEPGPCEGDAWLFNLVEALPEFVPVRGEPPLNAQRCSRAFDLDAEVRPEAFSVEGIDRQGRREYAIRYDGVLVGAIWLGAKSGYSRFATALSPVASPFPVPYP